MAVAPRETVMIACNHPQGLILNLDRYEPKGNQGQVQRINGKATVTLKGWSFKVGVEPDPTEGKGYRMTSVPREFWDAWFAANKESSLLTDRVILGPATGGDVAGILREHRDVKPMFRPAHPSDKSPDRATPGVEVGERTDKAA